MLNLYLTSVASNVIQDILKRINNLPKRCSAVFIPTAANLHTDKWFIHKDIQTLKSAGLKVTVLDIAKERREKAIKTIKEADLIFVSGGNVFYLMQEIKRKRLAQAIKSKIKTGTPYIGSSAGSAIVCPTIAYVKGIDDEKMAPDLKSMKGLNLIPQLVMPHENNARIKLRINSIKRKFSKYELICISDKEYIELKGNRVLKCKVI